MEILSPIIRKLHDEALTKKEKKLATLTKLALEDLELVQKRRIGGVSLPPPPSEMGDDAEANDQLSVQDIVPLDYIGDRYYKCYKLGCQDWMPKPIINQSLDAIQKLTAHGLLLGEEGWEFPNKDLKAKDLVKINQVLKAGVCPFDKEFRCTDTNLLTSFDRLWPPAVLEPKSTDTNLKQGSAPYKLIDDLINTICSCYNGPKTDEGIQLQVAQVLLTIFVNSAIKIHGATLLKMIQTLINMTIYAPKPVLQTTPKAILTQIVNLVVSRMEECNQKLKNQTGSNEAKSPGINNETNDLSQTSEGPAQLAVGTERSKTTNRSYLTLENLLFEKELLEVDSLLVLHLLTHLSLGFDSLILADQEAAILADSRSRAITLELILSMLNNSGRLFQTDSRFSLILKRNLCVSLSRNGISTDPVVFELSLSIFIVLFSSFRASLKSEIEVLFKEIYLRLINMQSSTYYQKSLILQALMKICRNPQAIVDMYVNYDCNLGSSSIFENMMDLLSKVAQGRQPRPGPTTSGKKNGMFNDAGNSVDLAEDKWLKVRGLRCLVTVLNSLVEWSKGSTKNPDSRADTPSGNINGDSEVVPVVVNKNHLEHVGNFDSALSNISYIDSRDGSGDDEPTKIQQISTKKQLWIHGINSFNQNPKKGLAELQTNGLVSEDPGDIANFFMSTNELSKQAIGTYMGRPDAQAVKVMHAFVDQFNFNNLAFISALRMFLQAFRLPREAQQIDRILEKFADRYCETNPKEFESADTAYVLAFSIMMLNTDQHSAQVRDRMDQTMFIRNNRGINNGKDLDESFLMSIFEDIVNQEIIMEEEHFNDPTSGPRERLIQYHQETAFLQKKLVSLFQSPHTPAPSPMFLSATHADHVKPMFAIAWYPVIAALSRIFEEINDTSDSQIDREIAIESTKLCLEGFVGAVRISSLHYMEIERNAFISALVKFTSINKVESLRPKNIHCIQTLISCAHSYGEFLDESWELILEAISRLEQLHLFGDLAEALPRGNSHDKPRSSVHLTSLSIDGKVTSTPRRITSTPMAVSQDIFHIENLRNQPLMSELLNELRSQTFLVVIDKIFTNSANFTGMSIIHFYRAICNVSLLEVDGSYPCKARTFSLHKIVEITYYNMKRIRLEWTQIWKILRPYFNTVGCSEDHSVAALAIDSLRQLSMKFFEREELSQYHTQHDFLKPFEHIARHNQSPAMQDLILQSLAQMINARASNIRSGWKSMFAVLGHLAATNPSLSVLASAFKLTRSVFLDHFKLLGPSFVDGVNCLGTFAVNRVSLEVATEAIQLMEQCSEPFLLSHPIPSNEADTDNPDDDLFLKWFPILSCLSRVTIDCHFEPLRDEALKKLFETIKRSGSLYNQNFWNSVLRSVILPIFDDLKLTSTPNAASNVLYCKAMTLLIDAFQNFYLDLSANPDFICQMFQLIAAMLAIQNNEKLTRSGLNMFKSIVLDNSDRFQLAMWVEVTKCLERFFDNTTPKALFFLTEDITPNDTKDVEDEAAEKVEDDVKDKSEFDVQNGDGEKQIDVDLNDQPEELVEDIPKETLAPLDEPSSSIPTPALANGLPLSKDSSNSISSTLPLTVDSINIASELFKCSVHLSLLQMVKDLITDNDDLAQSPISTIPSQISTRWLTLLDQSSQFAHNFNANHTLRHYLWTSGHVNQLPHLIRQETTALSIYLQLAFQLYHQHGDSFSSTFDLPFNLITQTRAVLDKFIELINQDPIKPREIVNWSHLVVQILSAYTDLIKMGENGPSYRIMHQAIIKVYFQAVDIIQTDRIEVRHAVQGFLKQIGTKHFFQLS